MIENTRLHNNNKNNYINTSERFATFYMIDTICNDFKFMNKPLLKTNTKIKIKINTRKKDADVKLLKKNNKND